MSNLNLKEETRRHHLSTNGALWRPEGETNPAQPSMPAFAKRRKTRATTRQTEEPTELALLHQREEQLAERVRYEQRRTGKERPRCFALSQLEVVRRQLAEAAQVQPSGTA